MKSLRLSLVTALALGTSAYAVDLENIKVSGQATLYYQTHDDSALKGDADYDLFAKEISKANVGLSIKFDSDLGNDFGFGGRLNVLDTLGLEGEVVNGVMQVVGAVKEEGTTATESDEWYWSEAYITKKFGNTLIKAGRQELNTPLAFSEKWNVMPTTFDAAVIVNSDLASNGVTLVGAYVSKSNNHKTLGNFNRVGIHGAYAVGALYNKDNIKANGWFYNVPSVANAYWVDATTDISGVKLTAQAGGLAFDSDFTDADDTNAFALKGSYSQSDMGLTVDLAVSQTTGDKNTPLNVANVGTGGIKTKLATATISGDGDVAAATDTTGYKLGLKKRVGENGKAILSFAQYIHGTDSNVKNKEFNDETATVLEAIYKQKFAGMNLLFAYLYDQNVNGWTSKLDDEAHTIRVVARYNF